MGLLKKLFTKKSEKKYPLYKPDQNWRAQLSLLEFEVTRQKETEPPFSGEYVYLNETGIYHCKCCEAELFDSATKFDSKTGWPSFYEPLSADALDEAADYSLLRRRTEVLCAHCGAHLGHVFPDGPQPTGLRYCINSVSLSFKQQK